MEMTIEEYEQLLDKVKKQYFEDLKKDRDKHGRQNLDINSDYVLGSKKIDSNATISDYSIIHYFVRSKGIRKIIFNEKKCRQELEEHNLLDVENKNNEEISEAEFLELHKYCKINAKYFPEALKRAKNNNVSITTFYKNVLDEYLKNSSILYSCYYYTTAKTKYFINNFILELNLTQKSGTIRKFHNLEHQNESEVYETETFEEQDRLIYMTLGRYRGNEPLNRKLYVIINKNVSQIEDLIYFAGSFSGVSSQDGQPIASEFIAIRNSNEIDNSDVIINAKKRINLLRNRFKLSNGILPLGSINNDDQSKNIDNSDTNHLDLIKGTLLIGRLSTKDRKADQTVIFSAMRVTKEYEVRINHTVSRKELISLPSLSDMSSLRKVLIVNVLPPGKQEPFIVFMMALPENKIDLSFGHYVGIVKNGITMSGEIVVGMLSDNPDHPYKPKRVLVSEILSDGDDLEKTIVGQLLAE